MKLSTDWGIACSHNCISRREIQNFVYVFEVRRKKDLDESTTYFFLQKLILYFNFLLKCNTVMFWLLSREKMGIVLNCSISDMLLYSYFCMSAVSDVSYCGWFLNYPHFYIVWTVKVDILVAIFIPDQFSACPKSYSHLVPVSS